MMLIIAFLIVASLMLPSDQKQDISNSPTLNEERIGEAFLNDDLIEKSFTHIENSNDKKSNKKREINHSKKQKTTQKASFQDDIKPPFSIAEPVLSFSNSVPTIDSIPNKKRTFAEVLQAQMDVFNNHYAPEKVYLHLDRTQYKPGEEVWFAVYVRDALTNLPSQKSGKVYVQWLNPKGTAEKRLTLMVEDGVAYGDIVLDEKIVGGQYKIKAFTNWQQNDLNYPVKDEFFTDFNTNKIELIGNKKERKFGIERSITVRKSVLPNLRMELEFAREAYGAGDEVIANLELKTLENTQLGNLDFRYVANADNDEIVNLLGKTDSKGQAKITFKLPKKLDSSDGLLNVVIVFNGQTESISRAIPIVVNNIDLQFLAESGNFLANFPNTVAFKALNEFGKPADVSGTIFNSKNEKVADFKSYHQGMGVVQFTPNADENYYAKITQPKGIQEQFALPTVQAQGYVLSFIKEDKEHLFLSAVANQNVEVFATATMKGKVYNSKKLELKAGENQLFKLAKKDMPAGVAHLTLFDIDKKPQAERLAFVNYDKKLDVKITTDKEKYLPREPVNLSIAVKDDKGNPVEGQFSLAVVDDKLLSFADDKQGQILAHFFLESELKGAIEEPNFYFENPEKHPEKDQLKALDDLMLTQGWRKVHWSDELDLALMPMKFQAEDAKIEGYVRDAKGRLEEGVEVFLRGTDFKTTTDKNGYFAFRGVPLQYGRRLILSTVIDSVNVSVAVNKYGEYNLINYGKSYTVSYEKTTDGKGGIKGTVSDKLNAEPILFATIALFKSVENRLGETFVTGVHSDFDGHFKMEKIEDGDYILKIQYVGYRGANIPVKIQAGRITNLHVNLDQNGVELNTVEIVAYTVPLIRQDGLISTKTITAQEIKKLPSKSISGIVATTAGVASDDDKKVTIRGSRSDNTAIYVDGVKVSGGKDLLNKDISDIQVTVDGNIEIRTDTIGNIYIQSDYSASDDEIIRQIQAGNTQLKIDNAQARYITIPAEYQTITKRIVKTPATTKTIDIPAEYKTVEKKVLIKAGTKDTPPVFDIKKELVLVKAASTKIEIVPAEYETKTEQILIKPQERIFVHSTVISSEDRAKGKSKYRIEVVPAKYETVTETVLAKAESKKLITVPAEYETVTETIEVRPAHTKWVKRKADRNCLSADPNDCQVWVLVEVPARYETITKTVLKTVATTKEVSVPAEYQTITKRIVKTPATTRKVEIPTGYDDASIADINAYHFSKSFKSGYYKNREFYNPKYTAKDEPVTMRNDFRSTIFWKPNVKTDKNGVASVTFYNSDDISTFKAVVEGIGNQGNIGRGEATYFTQLPFGMLMKTPPTVLFGDEITIPLTLMNNTDKAIEGQLFVKVPASFEAIQQIPTDITLKAREKRTLNLMYKVGTTQFGDDKIKAIFVTDGLTDAFEQPIRILKKGFPVQEVWSDNAKKSKYELNIQAPINGTIEGEVTIYPSAVSDIAESAKRMMRQPNGCFEQTSSTNYPNVLALQYLREQGLNDFKTEKNAKHFLEIGYKRLTSYEVEGGGFDWFGRSPAHEGLTAYGLMQFVEMQKVYPVEQSLIDRTANWLLSRKDGKGGWQYNKKHLHSWNGSEAIRNAYIVWALCEAGFGSQISSEIEMAYNGAIESQDPYIMGLMANALLENQDIRGVDLVNDLLEMQEKEGNWLGKTHSMTHSKGKYLSIETTALVMLAIQKANNWDESASSFNTNKNIDFIVKSKSTYGFGTTQSTVLAMKTLLENAKKKKSTVENGTALIYVNGEKVSEMVISNEQNQPLVINISSYLNSDKNEVKVIQKGLGEALSQDVALNYSTTFPINAENCAVELYTKLSAKKIKLGETVRLTATLKNLTTEKQFSPMAIVGIPSGLSVQLWQLKDLQEKGTFDYYELKDGYIVFYFRGLEANETKTIDLDLKADFSGTFEAPASEGYLYYQSNKKH